MSKNPPMQEKAAPRQTVASQQAGLFESDSAEGAA